MLDNGDTVSWQTTANGITTDIRKEAGGTISIDENLVSMYNGSSTSMAFHLDGGITSITTYVTDERFEQYTNSLSEENQPANGTITDSRRTISTIIYYYPNGTITIYEHITESIMRYIIRDYGEQNSWTHDTDHVLNSNFYTPENITKYSGQISSYEEVLKQHPIQTVDDASELLVNATKQHLVNINKEQLQEESILVFTSDYGLYWWDYKSGYDMILAELGWNHTTTQDIALIRGAANLQNKPWGTIITWKYTHPPYLASGEEMFEQLKTSYKTGAEYVLIFNYSEDPTNPNTLQEEHFQALERFWNDVVQNPKIKHGSIKAEAVLVLPQNYGWGMRHIEDTIWGIWSTDDVSQQIWNQLQNKLDKHGLKLDIIYEDPDYPVSGRYNRVYYWNQE